MKLWKPLLALALVVSAFAVPTSASADQSTSNWIVVYEPGSDNAKARQHSGADLDHKIKYAKDIEVVEATKGEAAKLRRHPHVVSVEPDAIVSLSQEAPVEISNDWYSQHQWHLENTNLSGTGTADADIDVSAAWPKSTGVGVGVAIIDTCVDVDHPELDGNSVWQWDLVHDDYDVTCIPGGHWHGTHVAGTVLAEKDNTIGVAGVAPDAKMLAIQVFDDDGLGVTSDILFAAAISGWAGLDIVNLSLGTPLAKDPGYAAVFAQYPRTLYVAAAGNNWGNNDVAPFYPASADSPNLIAVAASDRNDNHALFSNYSATSVDMHAPGVGILGPMPDNTYGYGTGTSMATPVVSGIAALVNSRLGIQGANLRNWIMVTAERKPQLSGLTVTGARASARVP